MNSSKKVAMGPDKPQAAISDRFDGQLHLSRFYSLALLIMAFFLARFNQTALYPLQEAMAAAEGLSDNYVALLQGPAFIMPFVILSVPLGMAVDRLVRVRLLVAAILCGIVGSLLTAWGSRLPALLLGRAFVGLSSSATTVIVFSMIADLFPPAQRGRAKSAADVAGQIGGSVAFLAGGMLLATAHDARHGWSWALTWMSTPLLLGMILLLTLREPARAGEGKASPPLRRMFIELRDYRALILPLVLGAVLIEIPIVATAIWAAPILTRSFSLGPGEVGSIMGSVLLVSGIAGPVLCGFLSDASQRAGGPRRAILAVALLMGLSAPGCLFGLAPTAFSAAVILGFFMTGLSGGLSMTITAFTIVIPNELRGLCLSLLSASAAIVGVALAPVLISLLSAALGGPAMIGQALALISLPSSLLAGASLLIGLHYLPRGASV